MTGRSKMMSVTSTGVRRPGSAIISTSFFAQVTHLVPMDACPTRLREWLTGPRWLGNP